MAQSLMTTSQRPTKVSELAKANVGSQKKRRKMRFFFWEDKLHKVLRINYPQNLVDAWCYSERKSVTLYYPEWRKNAKAALPTREVCKVLKVERTTLWRIIKRGEMRPPEKSYALDGKFIYKNNWWSEKSAIEAQEALVTHHIGRPNGNGVVMPRQDLPTKEEVRAYYRNEQTLYIRSEDGKMIPIFDLPKW